MIEKRLLKNAIFFQKKYLDNNNNKIVLNFI